MSIDIKNRSKVACNWRTTHSMMRDRHAVDQSRVGIVHRDQVEEQFICGDVSEIGFDSNSKFFCWDLFFVERMKMNWSRTIDFIWEKADWQKKSIYFLRRLMIMWQKYVKISFVGWSKSIILCESWFYKWHPGLFSYSSTSNRDDFLEMFFKIDFSISKSVLR